MVEQEQVNEIIKRLDLIVKLLSLNLIKDEGKLALKVKVLNEFGFQPKEIASLLDKTPNHIHQVLHTLRKNEGGSTQKEEKPK